MVIWSCPPDELNPDDLFQEWEDIHLLWPKVWAHRMHRIAGKPHPEVVRFESRPWLLVARYDALLTEFRHRGIDVHGGALIATDGKASADNQRMVVLEEEGGWESFLLAHSWPASQVHADSPWQEQGVALKDYAASAGQA